jgi:hypothetical protein
MIATSVVPERLSPPMNTGSLVNGGSIMLGSRSLPRASDGAGAVAHESTGATCGLW